MLTLDKVMSKNIYSLRKNDTLQDARILMLARHIHHVPIVDKGNKLLGLVSQRDILSISHSERLDVEDIEEAIQSKIKLASIMTTDVVTMQDSDCLLDATRHLLKNQHGCIPVEKGDALVGIITSFDFIKITSQYLEKELNQVES